jgi:hypothetical protein
MVQRANVPFNATDTSVRQVQGYTNVWFWKGKFLIVVDRPDNQRRFIVCNQFENGEGKDVCWFTNNLPSLHHITTTMNEELPYELVEDLHPANCR